MDITIQLGTLDRPGLALIVGSSRVVLTVGVPLNFGFVSLLSKAPQSLTVTIPGALSFDMHFTGTTLFTSNAAFSVKIDSQWNGTVSGGLLGSYDNNKTNDFIFRNGTVLPQSKWNSANFAAFGDSWRVLNSGLQDCLGPLPEVNQSPSTIPPQFESPQLEAAAIEACSKFPSPLRDDCLYDTAVTGDLAASETMACAQYQSNAVADVASNLAIATKVSNFDGFVVANSSWNNVCVNISGCTLQMRFVSSIDGFGPVATINATSITRFVSKPGTSEYLQLRVVLTTCTTAFSQWIDSARAELEGGLTNAIDTAPPSTIDLNARCIVGPWSAWSNCTTSYMLRYFFYVTNCFHFSSRCGPGTMYKIRLVTPPFNGAICLNETNTTSDCIGSTNCPISCSAFNSCSNCTLQHDCGWCSSSLSCGEGNKIGPINGSCPSYI